MTQAERPLSPHIQIYKPQISSVLSVLHRATGIALAAGAVFLVWWLLAAAGGAADFAAPNWFFGSWLGLVFLFGWCFSFFYHLANGIRHLAWDAGYGFEIPNFYRSGYAVIAVSIILTIVAFIGGIAMRG
ncbi:MAG: succinate dehydrogenase, cytochrome b556 subunit [Stellaceae bacterium]